MKEHYFYQPSGFYSFLKKYVVFTLNIFYESISVEGLENIPENTPVMYTPNHQNALMDALAIIVHSGKQPVFMAKADIFQQPTIAHLLNLIKIIPVYRIRDGIDNLSHNDKSFDIAFRCLLSDNCVGIMPEGTQTELQQLQPLKKGFARLALNAQDKIGEGRGVMIVPVGIHYRDFYSFRSNVHIVFGKPVDSRVYLAAYRNNPQKAFLDFKEKLSVELRKIMVSIDSREYYYVIKDTKDFVAEQFVAPNPIECDFANRFHAEKIITESMDIYFANHTETAEELKGLVSEYKASLKLLNIDNDAFSAKFSDKNIPVDVARFLFFLPLAALGLLFNALPALITSYISKRVDDPQFISSLKYGTGVVVFPVYYLLMLCLPYPFIFKILLLIIMPLLGVMAYDYRKSVRGFISFIRIKIGLNNNNTAISRLVYVRNQMVKIVRTCVDAI